MELDLQIFANFVHVETDKWPADAFQLDIAASGALLAGKFLMPGSDLHLCPMTSTVKELRLPVLMLKLAVKTGVSSPLMILAPTECSSSLR